MESNSSNPRFFDIPHNSIKPNFLSPVKHVNFANAPDFFKPPEKSNQFAFPKVFENPGKFHFQRLI